jgi:hypothetical protein
MTLRTGRPNVSQGNSTRGSTSSVAAYDNTVVNPAVIQSSLSAESVSHQEAGCVG